MFSPSAVHLKQYRECLRKQAELRESLALPKNDKEDYEFCKKYYELYKAKLFLGLL